MSKGARPRYISPRESLPVHSEDKAKRIAEFIVENRATIRCAARHFGSKKSTIHYYLRKHFLDLALYLKVRSVLNYNKAQMHIRGGEANRRKWEAIRILRAKGR